jgi:hypothetical protein
MPTPSSGADRSTGVKGVPVGPSSKGDGDNGRLALKADDASDGLPLSKHLQNRLQRSSGKAS